MAESGYFNTSNQYVKYWLEVITNSQNITNNTSNVTVKVWAKRTNTGYTTYGSGSVTLKVNGSYYNSGNKQIEITSSSKVYHTWTGNITHSADGTKKLTCSAAINIPSVLSSSEQSYSVSLKTIPRTSSFTLSKSTCELGTSFTVNISRASSSFTHSVSYTIGGERRYIQNWNGGSVNLSYTPPITDAVYMPNSEKMNTTITVDTYSGGTVIGTATKTLVITCPANIKPTFSKVIASKVANGDEAVTCLVQGYSKIRAVIESAKGIHGSTISRHYYTINNVNYNSTSNVQESGIITTAGDISVQAEVSDSRGRVSGVKSTTIRVEPYAKPFATGVIVRRVNDLHEYDTEGTLIHVKAQQQFSSLAGQNTCKMSVWWREAKQSWSPEIELPNNEDFYFEGARFTTDKAYEICIRVKDKLNAVDTYYNVPTGEVTLDFINGGKGFAVGRVAELLDTFDVNFNSMFRKDVSIINQLKLDRNIWMRNTMYIYGKTSDEVDRKMLGCSSYGNLVIGDDKNLHPSINMYAENLKLNGDHIVSRGSNSNGEWIRFYDGTQICTKTFKQGCERFPAWGNVFESFRFGMGNWAASFSSTPKIFCQAVQSEFACWVENCTGVSTSSCGSLALGRATNAMNVTAIIDIIAIGRWK